MDRIALYLPIIVLVVLGCALYVFDAPVRILTELINDTGPFAYAAFFVLLVLSVVCMPVAIVFVIPVVANIFGPFTTGTITLIGWTVGCMIAFWISQRYGRPIVARFVSLEKLDRYTEYIPVQKRFWMIVLLRLVFPADVLSYALGLSRSIGFWEHALATVLGIAWGSYAFAYMGDAFFSHDARIFWSVLGVFLAILIVCWTLLQYTRRTTDRALDSRSDTTDISK